MFFHELDSLPHLCYQTINPCLHFAKVIEREPTLKFWVISEMADGNSHAVLWFCPALSGVCFLYDYDHAIGEGIVKIWHFVFPVSVNLIIIIHDSNSIATLFYSVSHYHHNIIITTSSSSHYHHTIITRRFKRLVIGYILVALELGQYSIVNIGT